MVDFYAPIKMVVRRLNGYLEDYAFLADGLLALYEASFDAHWMEEAPALMGQAITLFADQQNGGFFDTGSDHESLISRPKDIMDNAIPAGNSVAVDVLLRLQPLLVKRLIANGPMTICIPLQTLWCSIHRPLDMSWVR